MLRGVDVPTWVLLSFLTLVVLLIGYDIVGGARSHRAFRRRMATVPTDQQEAVRARFLLAWAWQPWVLTIITLVLVAIAPGLSLADLGLRWPSLPVRWEETGGFLTGAVIGLVIVAVAAVVIMRRNRLQGKPAPAPQANEAVSLMLPTGRRDRRAWLLLSATAGITEEIMYRGLLVLTLSLALPHLDWFGIAALAVLAFGVAHAYQGLAGIILTATVGVPLLALYLVTGSLLPGIVLHFLIDARPALGAAGSQTSPVPDTME